MAREADAVVVTGGLGPTADDLTREAAARLLGRPLVRHLPTEARLRALWRRRGRPLPEGNLRQALFPRGAAVLPNPVGTAPGFAVKVGRVPLFCLPGPPGEMVPMLRRRVLPALRALRPGLPRVREAKITCCGVPESVVAERLGDLMDRDRPVAVGTTASGGVVTVRIHGSGAAAQGVAGTHREAVRRLGGDAFDPAGRSPAEALVALLARKGLTVATAESCTGGLVGGRITEAPGASAVFRGGVVAYENRVKESVLGVPRALLRKHGAVSAATAESMARGARRFLRADLAVAVTGIAGPGGGTRAKPVGLVWIAVADRRGAVSVSRRFPGDRPFVRALAVATALDLLRRRVQGTR
jgi:nicotinamide-nucleotide amidase